MKKYIIIIILLFFIVTLSSCSSKAERIYKKSSLDDFEKMEQLILLYLKEHRAESKYNDHVSDRAWDAIKSGNFDKAANITGAFKGGAGDDALYYLSLLQKELHQPEAVYIQITSRNGWDRIYYDFKVVIDYIDVKYRADITSSFMEYKLEIKDGPYEKNEIYEFDDDSYMIGSTCRYVEEKIHDLKHNNNSSPYYEFEIRVTAKTGQNLDYYCDSKEYIYKLVISDISKSGAGLYEFEYVGISEN